MAKRFIIHRQRKPRDTNVNEELQWFCKSLGLFGSRDKDRSVFRMFIVLIKDINGLTSDEIAQQVGLSRGTVVHHLHKLMNAGLVIKEQNKYMIRVNSLTDLVDEIERDILYTMSQLREVAEDIDTRLRL